MVALKKEELGSENVDAVKSGCKNLERHIKNIRKFGVPVISVGINDYVTDTENEHKAIIDFCKNMGVACKLSSHWEKGGKTVQLILLKRLQNWLTQEFLNLRPYMIIRCRFGIKLSI